MLRRLDRAVHAVAVAGAVVAALLMVLMTGLVGWAVIMRYMLGQPQPWSDELVAYLLVAVVMLGAAETLRRGEHIGIDLLTNRLGPRGRWWVEVWGMAAVVFVSAVLVRTGWQMVDFSRAMGVMSTGYLDLPLWLPQSVVPLGALLLGAAAVSRLLQLLSGRLTDGR